jgi:hypothetical protein
MKAGVNENHVPVGSLEPRRRTGGLSAAGAAPVTGRNFGGAPARGAGAGHCLRTTARPGRNQRKRNAPQRSKRKQQVAYISRQDSRNAQVSKIEFNEFNLSSTIANQVIYRCSKPLVLEYAQEQRRYLKSLPDSTWEWTLSCPFLEAEMEPDGN